MTDAAEMIDGQAFRNWPNGKHVSDTVSAFFPEPLYLKATVTSSSVDVSSPKPAVGCFLNFAPKSLGHISRARAEALTTGGMPVSAEVLIVGVAPSERSIFTRTGAIGNGTANGCVHGSACRVGRRDRA